MACFLFGRNKSSCLRRIKDPGGFHFPLVDSIPVDFGYDLESRERHRLLSLRYGRRQGMAQIVCNKTEVPESN